MLLGHHTLSRLVPMLPLLLANKQYRISGFHPNLRKQHQIRGGFSSQS
jgi:hypothetical protein